MAKKKKYEKSFFIKLNMQNPPKPRSMNWWVRKADNESIPEFTVCGYEFTIEKREDSLGEVEGFNPDLNFRRAFLPEEGHYWVSRDFSGQELRILANLANEKVWINTFLSGGDVHKATAIAVFGKENYSKENRKKAKGINFGLVYGISAKSLGEDLGVSTKEAQSYMDTFFEKLPNIKRYLDRCAMEASQTGMISNIYGRRRRMQRHIDYYGKLDSSGIRKSYNFPVQSMGAEITKLAMIKIYRGIVDKKMFKDGDYYFINTIHDEINSSVAYDIVEEAAYQLGRMMEHKMPGYPVPIISGLEIGHSMGLTWKFEQDLKTLELTPVLL